MVVVDTMPAEITGYADVVLPECTYLERYDDLRNKAERMPTLALRMPAFTNPATTANRPGGSPSSLAEKLGLGDYFPWQDYREVLDWQLKQVGSSLAEMQTSRRQGFPRKTPVYFDSRRSDVASTRRAARSNSGPDLLADIGQDPLPRYTPPDRPPQGFFHLNYGRAPAHTFGRTINNPAAVRADARERGLGSPERRRAHRLASGDYVRAGEPAGPTQQPRTRTGDASASVPIPSSWSMASAIPTRGNAWHVASVQTMRHLMHNVKIDPIMGGTGMRASFVALVKSEVA